MKNKIPNIPKCPPVPPISKMKYNPFSDTVYKEIYQKFYNLIKKKVKFDGNYCSKCKVIPKMVGGFCFCGLFQKKLTKVIKNDFQYYSKRCRQCKTYFGK